MFKTAAFAFFPVPLCVGTLLAGLVLLWFTGRQRLGKILVTCGFGLLVLASNPLFADWMIFRLEWQYRAASMGAVNAWGPDGKPRYVVVLSGELKTGEGLPPTSRLGAITLMRLAEGIRLQRGIPGSTLILSGGNDRGETEAAAMAELAMMLGVSKQDIIMEARSLSTSEQAEQVKEIVGGDPIILVTSANHMPRAMRLFQQAGMNPIAAPTAHRANGRGHRWMPSSGALDTTSEAFYERLASLKASLFGRN